MYIYIYIEIEERGIAQHRKPTGKMQSGEEWKPRVHQITKGLMPTQGGIWGVFSGNGTHEWLEANAVNVSAL